MERIPYYRICVSEQFLLPASWRTGGKSPPTSPAPRGVVGSKLGLKRGVRNARDDCKVKGEFDIRREVC